MGSPLPSRLGGLGERRELPQRGPGRSGCKRICSIFLGHRAAGAEGKIIKNAIFSAPSTPGPQIDGDSGVKIIIGRVEPQTPRQIGPWSNRSRNQCLNVRTVRERRVQIAYSQRTISRAGKPRI